MGSIKKCRHLDLNYSNYLINPKELGFRSVRLQPTATVMIQFQIIDTKRSIRITWWAKPLFFYFKMSRMKKKKIYSNISEFENKGENTV